MSMSIAVQIMHVDYHSLFLGHTAKQVSVQQVSHAVVSHTQATKVGASAGVHTYSNFACYLLGGPTWPCKQAITDHSAMR